MVVWYCTWYSRPFWWGMNGSQTRRRKTDRKTDRQNLLSLNYNNKYEILEEGSINGMASKSRRNPSSVGPRDRLFGKPLSAPSPTTNTTTTITTAATTTGTALGGGENGAP